VESGRISSYSSLKLGHFTFQLRTLAPELGQHRPRKKNILRTVNKGCTLLTSEGRAGVAALTASLLAPPGRIGRHDRLRSGRLMAFIPMRVLSGMYVLPGMGDAKRVSRASRASNVCRAFAGGIRVACAEAGICCVALRLSLVGGRCDRRGFGGGVAFAGLGPASASALGLRASVAVCRCVVCWSLRAVALVHPPPGGVAFAGLGPVSASSLSASIFSVGGVVVGQPNLWSIGGANGPARATCR
jgi:hypothetical protein